MTDILVQRLVRGNLEQLLELLRTGGETLSPARISESIYACLIMGDQVERYWELLRDRLTLGMDDRELIAEAREVAALTELVSQACTSARAKLPGVQLTSPLQAQQDRLNRYSLRMAELHGQAEKLLAWAETPAPHIDPASIPKKGNPLTGEGFKSAAQILAELQRKQG